MMNSSGGTAKEQSVRRKPARRCCLALPRVYWLRYWPLRRIGVRFPSSVVMLQYFPAMLRHFIGRPFFHGFILLNSKYY